MAVLSTASLEDRQRSSKGERTLQLETLNQGVSSVPCPQGKGMQQAG